MDKIPAGRPRRVALVVWNEFGYSVRIGVGSYARPEHGWELCEPPFLSDIYAYLRHLRPDGIIVYASGETIGRRMRRFRCPVVNVSARLPDAIRLPTVCVDSMACCEVAVDHFLARGFHNFAFASVEAPDSDDRIRAAFCASLRRAGFDCAAWSDTPTREWVVAYLARPFSRQLLATPRRWLKNLPKPVAILCAGDGMALALSSACVHLGLAVPDEVAILDMGNDPLRCATNWPPVSSIVQDVESIGYRAAELLDRLMSGERPPNQRILISPRGVATRLSTDVSLVTDPCIGRAVGFIRSNIQQPLSVPQIATAIGVGRRTLERRFAALRGHSIQRQIHLARLERTQELLAKTDKTLIEIAECAGFGSMVTFYKVFGRHTGTTPAAYRRQFRATPR